jgi:hypothetical protein
MIWNGLSSDERLRLWKNLRKGIADSDFKDRLLSIAEFYRLTPFGARTIDYYDAESWPLPWEMLFHGDFCKSSISLMIFYTVTMVSPDCKAQIQLVDEDGEVYLVPLFDDQFILNFTPGQISKYQDLVGKVRVIRVFEKEHIKKIN